MHSHTQQRQPQQQCETRTRNRTADSNDTRGKGNHAIGAYSLQCPHLMPEAATVQRSRRVSDVDNDADLKHRSTALYIPIMTANWLTTHIIIRESNGLPHHNLPPFSMSSSRRPKKRHSQCNRWLIPWSKQSQNGTRHWPSGNLNFPFCPSHSAWEAIHVRVLTRCGTSSPAWNNWPVTH